VGRTGIYACGESVSRCNSSESVVLFSWKQEAPASIGGGTFTQFLMNIFQKSRYNKQIIFINRGTGSEIWRIYG